MLVDDLIVIKNTQRVKENGFGIGRSVTVKLVNSYLEQLKTASRPAVWSTFTRDSKKSRECRKSDHA